MDVMKAVKNVLSWAFVFALIAMIFSPLQARADGMHGVRETAREILVDVPKFCKPVEFRWEMQWQKTTDNEDSVLSLVERDEKKVVVRRSRPGDVEFATVWRGGDVVHIKKFDARDRPIKMGFISILALGGGEKLLNKNNWVFIFADGRVVDISPPVNVGVWGKCT